VTTEMSTFVNRLGELGYSQDKNLELIARFADGMPARMPGLARELVNAGVEVVFVPNTQGATELQKLSDHVAIIFVSGDPVKAGLVASLARPGRNATGFTLGDPSIAGKRVQLLKEEFPSVRRLGVLFDPKFPVSDELELIKQAAQQLGIEVLPANASSRDQYLEALRNLQDDGVDGLYVVYTGSSFAIRRELANAIRQTHVPAIYGVTRFADDGGLIAYSRQTLKVAVLAADYVDRILKGARPADLPVQEPTAFELIVNVATARAQGLKLPQSLLLRADRLIE
jgi:putative ABC transport system substrate-binding protein